MLMAVSPSPVAPEQNVMMKRRTLLAAATALPAALLAARARSQSLPGWPSWPARPVKLIVPFAPGGSTDILGRVLAQRLGDLLKQAFVVDNRPGAGAMVGADAAAKSAPDGYTLVMSNNASHSIGPQIYANPPYRPLEDFAHIALLGTFPNMFIVRADHPAKTFAEWLALARAKPGVLNFASAGVGSAGFLTGELLKLRAAIDIVHIPYKGTGPANADLLGGQLDAVFDGPVAAGPHLKSGRTRALAVTSDKRIRQYPDVPTMDELVPGVTGEAWFGVSAPARTPREVIERLQTELMKLHAQPEFAMRLFDIGLTPRALAGADFTAFVRNEFAKWTPVIKAAGVRVD